MAVLIDNETDYVLSTEHEALIKRLIAFSVKHEQCPFPVEVSLTLVSNEEIKQLNAEYRDKDQVTDVLSFPLIEFEIPSQFEALDEVALEELMNLDTKELVLGDIVISIDKAKEQAVTYGHSFERELGFLIVHSMLHLFGYDHMNEEDEQAMFQRQEAILEEAGLTR